MLKNLLRSSSPIIVSHRGCSKLENKLAGFVNGVRAGCKLLECDVRLSKDFKSVVIHDKTINRTSNGLGKVRHMNKNELLQYDIPSFEDLADWLLHHENICLLVEIKDVGDPYNDILISEVVKVVKEKMVTDRCMIISFNKKIIFQAKQMLPEISTGLLYGPLYLNCPFSICQKYKVDYLLIHHSVVSPLILQKSKLHQVELFVWTVNNMRDMNKLLNFKITGIITDFPDMAFACLTK